MSSWITSLSEFLTSLKEKNFLNLTLVWDLTSILYCTMEELFDNCDHYYSVHLHVNYTIPRINTCRSPTICYFYNRGYYRDTGQAFPKTYLWCIMSETCMGMVDINVWRVKRQINTDLLHQMLKVRRVHKPPWTGHHSIRTAKQKIKKEGEIRD